VNDFAVYVPSVRPSAVAESFTTRAAVTADVDALATVMAARGGSVEERADQARKMIAELAVLLIAEKDGYAVGWCGAQKVPIHPKADPEWLIAGLTVIPDARRQGIASRLLSEVLRDASGRAPGESVFSVINARNLASIDLHLKLGFVEVGRSASYAGIEFTGGEGVLVRRR
jgi:ribosomal protein S18 acetylase RimI-like enzyme